MYGTVVAFRRFCGWWCVIFIRNDEIRGVRIVVISRIRNIFLGDGGKIYDSVCDRICTPKCENDARN